MKIDINVLIKKIEDKIIKKGMCFLPEISKSTRNRINRKNKTLLNEIDNFLEKPLGIKELNIQSQDLINKLKNIV